MTRILCMSHGPLAKGMVETTKFIVGETALLDYACAYIDGNNDVDQLITQYLNAHQEQELIVITDIFGGSINNAWLKIINTTSRVHLISGMNLSFVIELLLKVETETQLDELILQAMQTANDSFTYCNLITYEDITDEF